MSPKSLGKALRRLSARMDRRQSSKPRNLPPDTLLNLRMEYLEKQLEEVKGRVNALMLIILAAVITDVVMRALT